MIEKIKNKIKNDELLKGSFILFIMINVFNLLNQVFHLVMARLLGPVDYGTLAVLFSLIYIFSIPSEAIQNIVTSYVSRLNMKKENGKIRFFLFKSFKKSAKISIFLFILFIPVAFVLSYFLKIDYFLFLITGLSIFLFFYIPLLRGVMQGQKKFSSLGFNMIIEGTIKVVFGVIFVILGLKVYGSIFAVLLATFVSILIAFMFIKDIVKAKEEKEDFKGIYKYSMPYFICMIAIVLMYSLDVVFAKRFFSPEIAGKYSAASTLGKIIFFGILAIGKAMLPLASEKHQSGEKTSGLLRKSLIISMCIAGIILVFYYFMPGLIITILFGSKYIEVSNIVFIIGLALSFLSFANIILLYGLSVNKIKNSSFFLFIFVILEIIIFYMFHESVIQYSIGFLAINFLIFIYSLLLIKD